MPNCDWPFVMGIISSDKYYLSIWWEQQISVDVLDNQNTHCHVVEALCPINPHTTNTMSQIMSFIYMNFYVSGSDNSL